MNKSIDFDRIATTYSRWIKRKPQYMFCYTDSGYTIGVLPGGGSQVYIPKYNDMYIVFITQNNACNNH